MALRLCVMGEGPKKGILIGFQWWTMITMGLWGRVFLKCQGRCQTNCHPLGCPPPQFVTSNPIGFPHQNPPIRRGFIAVIGWPALRELSRSKYTVNPGYAPVADCFCVRFSPDDQYLATSFANGAIHVYSAETGRKQRWRCGDVHRSSESLVDFGDFAGFYRIFNGIMIESHGISLGWMWFPWWIWCYANRYVNISEWGKESYLLVTNRYPLLYVAFLSPLLSHYY